LPPKLLVCSASAIASAQLVLSSGVVLVLVPDEVLDGVVVVPDDDELDEEDEPPAPPIPVESTLELQPPASAEAATPMPNKPIKWVIFIAISAASE